MCSVNSLWVYIVENQIYNFMFRQLLVGHIIWWIRGNKIEIMFQVRAAFYIYADR